MIPYDIPNLRLEVLKGTCQSMFGFCELQESTASAAIGGIIYITMVMVIGGLERLKKFP